MSTRTSPDQTPHQAPAPSDADYEAASRWAETATFEAADFISAEQTPDFGRDLIRSARSGRPTLDPSAPGQESRNRHVRLDRTLDQELEQFLAQEKRSGRPATTSSVIRTALRAYLSNSTTQAEHPA